MIEPAQEVPEGTKMIEAIYKARQVSGDHQIYHKIMKNAGFRNTAAICAVRKNSLSVKEIVASGRNKVRIL